jgi:MinD-like ATPase involved in chromosome partitioning or flagellar assembly
VLLACWSAKGGVGTTVTAAAVALSLARRSHAGAVLADLAGDGAAVLGLAEPESPGLAGWLAAGDDVPADALARLEVDAGTGLALLPRGTATLAVERAGVLATLLDAGARPVVADCGSRLDEAVVAFLRAAGRSVVVTRPCYLALRRTASAPLAATEVVLVHDAGRVLDRADVEGALNATVVAEIPDDPAIARAVDAGLLAARLPRSLERAVRRVA